MRLRDQLIDDIMRTGCRNAGEEQETQ
jgi:hypothetical protein